MKNLESQINNEILDVWQKYDDDPQCNIKEAPGLFQGLVKDGIAFIGINPSSSEKGLKQTAQILNKDFSEILDLLKWKGKSETKLDALLKLQATAQTHYPYFQKFKDIATKLQTPYSYINLFFYREKVQSQFQSLVYRNNQLTPFGLDQFNLALKAIDLLTPKAILIANALASRIFKNHAPQLNKTFNEDLGCYLYKLSTGQNVPVFFSSMLSGRSALDQWSYERLVWQIKRNLKN